MKKHALLVFEIMSRSMRLKLLLLTFALFLGGLYDLLNPILFDRWYLIWLAFVLSFCLWFYYGFLMRRASLQLKPDYLRIQGPIVGMNVSYRRIQAVKAVRMGHEWPAVNMPQRDRGRLGRLAGTTAVLVTLSSEPDRYKSRHVWFPRYLFGTSERGLLLATPDWMAVSQALEEARSRYHRKRAATTRRPSLASRVMDD